MLEKINCALYIAFSFTVFTVYLKMAKYCLINCPDWSVFYFCKLCLQQVRVKATGSKTWRERKQEWVWRLNTLTALDIQPTSQQKRFTGLGNWQMSYSTKQRNEVKWMGQLCVGFHYSTHFTPVQVSSCHLNQSNMFTEHSLCFSISFLLLDLWYCIQQTVGLKVKWNENGSSHNSSTVSICLCGYDLTV